MAKAGRTAGYSGTPLVKKLGIKPNFRIKTKNAPDNYLALIAPLPEGVKISSSFRKDVDLWHLFTKSRAELVRTLPRAMQQIRRTGMIWISWPKRASGVATDIVEGTLREVGLPLGLVDIKVCAVDETWSGLKLVIRKENR